MKFVSKSANYLVVLKASIPSEPLSGRGALPGLTVRFEDGMVDVTDEKICELLMQNHGYERDFFLVNDNKDPFQAQREEMEPQHLITGIKHGAPEKTIGSPKKIKLPPELNNYIAEQVQSGIKEGMSKLIPDLLKELSTVAAASKKTSKKKTTKKVSPKAVKEEVVENTTEENSAE